MARLTNSIPNLPAADGQAEPVRRGGGENRYVLVVDDDDLVRIGATRCLERLGYRTAAASDAEKALVMLRSGEVRADLLFTDIRMPGAIDGVDLAQIVRREFPEVAILLTTGFAGNRPEPRDTRILYKPYKIADLDHAVRDSLAGHDRPA